MARTATNLAQLHNKFIESFNLLSHTVIEFLHRPCRACKQWSKCCGILRPNEAAPVKLLTFVPYFVRLPLPSTLFFFFSSVLSCSAALPLAGSSFPCLFLSVAPPPSLPCLVLRRLWMQINTFILELWEQCRLLARSHTVSLVFISMPNTSVWICLPTPKRIMCKCWSGVKY